MRFLITRPQPDAQTLAKRLRELGHESLISPVMEVACLSDEPLPDPSSLDGLIITSRNALRCLAQKADMPPLTPSPWHQIPLFCVGQATGREARDLGFTTIIYGEGQAKTLPRFINQQFKSHSRRLYYPAGRKKAFDLAPVLRQQGYSLIEQCLYETRPVEQFTPDALNALQGKAIDAVLLLSPRTAKLFARLIEKNNLYPHISSISALCLSQNIAKAAASLPWKQTLAPAHPDLDRLLDLIDQIHHQ